ncbi:ABC transporter substrate-binding protein [Microlunatus parietis]|uniref:Multiple sugar transport system substrate-binding protein n=1 Tax=Microlunatus parietis TaxID=682979 RepID=A0A7Y9IF69_9ACTN|nr:extracellular solute-binding protein [Microlunatus parietis]NYE75094.1 multiple sugar transport system substrate-binding protein [Microlunatus parietis]
MALRRRAFLTLSGGLAAAAGLTACGSNTGRPEPGGSAPATGGAKPTLSQWYHEYGEDGVEEAVKRYAAAYDQATVTVQWNPGDYEKLVSSALLTDKAPDVFEYANGPTLDMIKAGQALDLTTMLGDAKPQFTQSVLDAASWEGKVYSIPQTVDMQMLFYRKSVLDQAGVAPPATIDDLIKAVPAVQSKDMGGFYAGTDGGIGVLSSMFIWAAGQEQISADKTTIGFDNAEGHAAFAKFAELAAADGYVPSASGDWSTASPFVNGETAMQWSGLWILPEVTDALGDDFGVLPFPSVGAAGRPAVPFGAFGACVNAKGKNVEAATEFVRWLWVDQEDYQLEFSNAFGTHIPAKTALVPKADKVASGAGAEAAKFVAEFGHANDKLWTPAIQQAITAAVTNVVQKKADPKSEIAEVAATAKADIKRLNG